MTADKIVRIGGGSAFFVDSALFMPQLVAADVDYILLDYLAEGSMGLFGRALKAGEGSGYPPDFLDVHIGPHLAAIADKGIRVVANAGALDPVGLAEALRGRIADLGLGLSVSAVSGDNLIEQFEEIAPRIGMADIGPNRVTSLTAYLGAFPIAEALKRGADIVVTGRAVDSALALGPLVYEFGWRDEDWDLLAAGTVAGHLIECGAQATGGTFTDWRDVEGWEAIGPPIAECRSDGSCMITKPSGTGGIVSVGTVAEQLLYEVGDPQAYHTPDLTCDFTTVRLDQDGEDRVRVTGATGYPPTSDYKICATWDDGWRAIAYQPVIGPDARAKAEKQAAALFARGSAMLRGAQLADWRRTEAVPFGGEEEIVLKLVVEHDAMLPCQLFVREQLMAISGMAPGTSVGFGTQIQPVMRFASAFLPKDEITPSLDSETFDQANHGGFSADMIVRPSVPA
ncbi:MAG: acyclic terpene utilization AtuA family protein, partial [Pseudomonadota bacterium]